MERSFYPGLLGYDADAKWLDQLVEALRNPGVTVNYLGALGWRLRRTYLWIYGAVLVTWIAKLNIETNRAFTPERFEAHAVIGHVPGWIVIAGIGIFYACLVAIGAHRIYPLGDDDAQQVMKASAES
jgi:uncharacterized membrane protein